MRPRGTIPSYKLYALPGPESRLPEKPGPMTLKSLG
jgi:hypothetical protein